MAEDDKDSRTEEASEHKLRKAKEEGDSWTSREPGHVLATLALLSIVAIVGPSLILGAVSGLSSIFDQAGLLQIETTTDLSRIMGQGLWGAALLFLGVLGALVVAAIVAAVISGPFVVAQKRIQPKLSKINPFAGLKRVFSLGNLVEFCKNLVKLLLIMGLMLWVLWGVIDRLLPGSVILPEYQPSHIAKAAERGLTFVFAIMLPVLIFDVFWKRRQWMQKQRMSLKDKKDEHKNNEGDPMIRARRQEIGRNRIRQNIKKAVPQATLVVMNPTHYAVALRYERGVDQAPICVAKGMDLLALRIRDLALESDVVVMESPPLARALHAVAELDKPIPEEHWAAVAELVGYVLDLRRRIRRKLPEGTVQIN